MMTFALKSLWNRRFVALLTVLSIALSVLLILGVERLRSSAKESFANSASGIDLIVAARGNSVQILMATVFGTGSTGPGITWDSYEMIEDLPQVAWALPLSLGDNHRGFPVVGTTHTFFEHFRYSGGQVPQFAQGGAFAEGQDAVIGADIAARLNYDIGKTFIVAHGAGDVAFDRHDEAPFTVTGILSPTGTALDRKIMVSLEGFDALHPALEGPRADPFSTGGGDGGGDEHPRDQVAAHEPDVINAVYVGLANRAGVLSVQGAVNNYHAEALSAVLPSLALIELWSITGTAERALMLMASAVALAGIFGMIVMLTASLEARRREFAILRSVGATPSRIFSLIVLEAAALTLAGIGLGLVLLWGTSFIVTPFLARNWGIHTGSAIPGARDIALIGILFLAGLLASLLPAVRVYRLTLVDGLSFRL